MLLIGGLLNIMYGENIGVLVIMRVYSVYLFIGLVVFVIMFGFIGKIFVLIYLILILVMGGVLILLFGVIVLSGLCMMVDDKIDLSDKWNLMIVLVILVIGIGGVVFYVGELF